MDSLSTLIYNKTLLISKWEKTGILEYLDCKKKFVLKDVFKIEG